MTWVIGTVGKNVNNTNPCTTVAITITLTAGRSYLVAGCGFQTGGGTRTLTCASDLDGTLGTADLDSGAQVSPLYVWRKDAAVGGSTTITVTSSGNMVNMMVLVTEVQVAAMVKRGTGLYVPFTAVTAWDSGPFDTVSGSELLYVANYVTNRADGVISAADDNNGNAYTVGQVQDTSGGESVMDAYFFGTLAQENAEAEVTMSVSSTGRQVVLAYGAAAAAAPIGPLVGSGKLVGSGNLVGLGPLVQAGV
jgi:hypothetical protein